MSFFLINQSKENRYKYNKLLKLTCSLSNLFSDNSNPFLYYRAMENIFCKAFDAENLSRSDVSADASKDGLGIGLKTFLHNNGMTFQKVAEFNKESHLFRKTGQNLLSKEELKEIIICVSDMRNQRISFTKRAYKLDDMIYHSITRSYNEIKIYEEHMDEIDLNSVRIVSHKQNTITFKDKVNEYSFSLSKNTLFKRFITQDDFIEKIEIKIYEDPFYFLMFGHTEDPSIFPYETATREDFIVLPLYSPRTGKVEVQSGLNQWNSGGRLRNPNEVYIPVPKWIHTRIPDFFNYEKIESRGDEFTTDRFDVLLPDKTVLKMKIAQTGGKGLMSAPNSDLGKWILRDVLNIPTGELVTLDILERKGIDSVKLTKISKDFYALDFLSTGSFEEFRKEKLDNIEI